MSLRTRRHHGKGRYCGACLPAHALLFEFSFADDASADIFGLAHIPGTVTGTLELQDNVNGQVSSEIIITSAPAGLEVTSLNVDIKPLVFQETGSFDVAGGVITAVNDYFFDFDDPNPGGGATDIVGLRFNDTTGSTININALTNDGIDGSAATEIGVTGNRDGFAGVSFSAVLPNMAPTAEAGGPYVFSASNLTVSLDSSGSTDDGTITFAEWNIAGGIQDLSGTSFVVPLSLAEAGLAMTTTTTTTTTATLTVTDDGSPGLTDSDTADISYQNAVPTVTDASATNVPVDQVDFAAVFGDDDLIVNGLIPGFESLMWEFDVAAALTAADIGDGFLTGTGDTAAGSQTIAQLVAIYGSEGDFDAFFNVKDKAGAVASF
ncbi:MAG: hypothetical protein AAF333_18280 [Planctomycetota bacterium]